MSSSDSRSQMINPFLVKAGIPAALSVAAYICAKLISRRSKPPSSSQQLIQYSTSYDEHHEDGDDIQRLQATETTCRDNNLEDKLLELESHVEYLQRRERDLKMKFLQYQAMKERQFMLLELRQKMILEKIGAEYLVKELGLVQDETKRMGGLILEVIKLVQKLEDSKMENGLLERKARELCKRGRQRLKKVRELKLRIEAKEMEILSNQEELQRKDGVIHELEDEVTQMREVIHHLQRQKVEISGTNNLAMAQHPCSFNPKNEIGVREEEHEKVVDEIEKLKKDREMEANEVRYLRWSNACLRNELAKLHELNKDCYCHTTMSSQDYELCSCNPNNTNQHPSRRRRFFQKVKNWVDGGIILDSKPKANDVNCFGRHSLSEEAQDLHLYPRNSCSSV